ncbi:ABC-type transport system involved in resistance to organic solvents permease component [Paramagnetospirillum magnetotacticum MS-1]|uniref:ABC-type transport system involved in resistance to organic solvents permease component n=1 Tax=Paramagnetospirillum magnetotacticum MS-1 TaxID=272627 RepID=A0A0C2U9R7_PARME|nr:ABC transporter permease [Paramagnetospirillum magnetotacticum]KIL98227.1 ABC-type transport system involved in resistance to organic solvents permease component [Paramagnetospirillum magnetotacticum MS-1]
MSAEAEPQGFIGFLDRLGRRAAAAIAEFGFGATLLGESLYWLGMGKKRRQPVRLAPVVAQAMEIGIGALPIVTVLSATIGIMLAIQGIYTLRLFGAESRVSLGVAMSVVREFGPLITGILVAGRSGSALAARLGTMRINQEIDALTVMGVSPVRFLVVPPLLAMMVMLPALTLWSDLVGLFAAGLYIAPQLGSSMGAYVDEMTDLVRLNDVWHGLGKSAIFSVLITLVGVVNGASVTGGAEGVGRLTTRSVVHAISAIVVTDMIFVFMVTR